MSDGNLIVIDVVTSAILFCCTCFGVVAVLAQKNNPRQQKVQCFMRHFSGDGLDISGEHMWAVDTHRWKEDPTVYATTDDSPVSSQASRQLRLF